MPIFFPPGTSAVPANARRFEDDFRYPTGSLLFRRWTITQVGSSVGFITATAAQFGELQYSVIGAGWLATLSKGVGAFVLPAGFWQVNCNFTLSALSVAADRYTVRLGFGDVAGGDFNNGVYFEYSDNANGGRWQLCTAKGGVKTKQDSFRAATTSRTAFRFTGRGAGPAVFSINNQVCGAVASNIPSAAIGLVLGIYNSSATVAHNALIDYAAFYYTLS